MGNHHLRHIPTDIYDLTVMNTANMNTENYIHINSITDYYDEPGYVEISLTMGNFSSRVKNYIRSNNGILTVDLGVVESGYSWCHYRNGRTRRYSKKSRKTNPGRYFSTTHSVNFNIHDVDNTFTTEVYLPKPAFLGNEFTWYDFGKEIIKKTKAPESISGSSYRYILNQLVFRMVLSYVSMPGGVTLSPYIFNSDQIVAKYTFISPQYSNTDVIYSDPTMTVFSNGRYPWIYNNNNRTFRNSNQGINNSYSVMVIKFNSSVQNIDLDFDIESEEGCDEFIIFGGNKHTNDLISISGNLSKSYTLNIDDGEEQTYIICVYRKDYSVTDGSDTITINNISIVAKS